MSWLITSPATRDELLALHPGLAADHQAVLEAVWQGPVDPQILELCRLRMATLLANTIAWTEPRSPQAVAAGLDESLIGALSSWSTNPDFDAATRACIGLAEQYVIDVHGITDQQVAELEEHISADGVVTLTTALAIWDLTHRFDNALVEPAQLDDPGSPEGAV